jgi:type IV pilus assembly protein PilW
MNARSLPPRMQGVSLVELMIAMTLGLATVAAVGWVYLGTMKTYRTHDAISRLQEGARHAFEVISKDLRMSGAVGCPYSTHTNAMSNPTDWYTNLFDLPISSIEQDAADVAEVNEYSDALQILRADVSREFIVEGHNAGTMTFTLADDHDIENGELLVATDCSHAAVFQATGPTDTTVGHATGGTPGNASGALGASYTPGSRLYRLKSATYYVAPNTALVPSLFRLVPTGSSATLEAQELVEGVADLQVTYGVDIDPTPDGIVDLVGGEGYLTADEVDSGSVPGANAAEKWSRVVSVRISLLMQTAEDRIISTPQFYSYNGTADIEPPDLRIRKVFTHVIKVRNR